MKQTNKADFDRTVIAASRDTDVVVLFHAPWCGPCKSLKPLLERVTQEMNLSLVGVDGSVETALVSDLKVRGVPTIFLYRDGKQISSTVGGKTESQLKQFFADAGIKQGLSFDI